MDEYEEDSREWLLHIRAVSRRINGIVGHIVPGAMRFNHRIRYDVDWENNPIELYGRCRIRDGGIGFATVNISYWGLNNPEVEVSTVFERGRATKASDTLWKVYHSYGRLDELGRKFSEAHLIEGRVRRINELIPPLYPLFSDDRLERLAGFSLLEELERAAGIAPPARTGKGAGA